MKLVIVKSNGETLGEVKLSTQLLRRSEILSERIQQTIMKSLSHGDDHVDDRIVQNEGRGKLETLDDDSSIMDVPLRLSEACTFDFDKHADAIVATETEARETHSQKYTGYNSAQLNSKKWDAKYKEHHKQRMRVK